MAEAAICTVPQPLHGNNMVLTGMAGKRKTPSELRVEQLKRLRTSQNLAIDLVDKAQNLSNARKNDAPKLPRFIDTRVADVYAATKPGDRSKFFSKDKQKDAPLFPQKCESADVGVHAATEVCTKPSVNLQWKRTEANDALESENGGTPSSLKAENGVNIQRVDSASFNTFKDVTQISSGLQETGPGPSLDMVKAFKGMAAPKPSVIFGPLSSLAPASKGNIHVKPSSFVIQTEKFPLDLSLKTNIRFTSSVSFQRCQRISNMDQLAGLQNFLHVLNMEESGDLHRVVGPSSLDSFFARALHSWAHPQSVLPSSVLSALATSAAHGGTSERDFLLKRQQHWEDSFRSLYYMFRNRQCDIFYVSSQHFLAMFIGGCFNKVDKKKCSAYITRSTRGLRGLLQEQDIAFSMPSCPLELDTMTVEEIQELSEFEKNHPGQTRLVDSMIAVDNSPQSVLAFRGHKSVHGLYDFLLNHRVLMSSTTGADIPVLYSPVSFQNAALVTPEVVCKQLQRPPEIFQNKEQSEIAHLQENESLMSLGFSLELKGTTLPPWIVWRVFRAIQQFQPGDFDASLSTDPLSSNLNIALDFEVTAPDVQLDLPAETFLARELKTFTDAADMQGGYVKHVRFSEGSYVATVSTI